MANGSEDLKEKNKGRLKPKAERRYKGWRESYGEEDGDMLLEKASRWSAVKENRGDYDDDSDSV